MFRDWKVSQALEDQPVLESLGHIGVQAFAAVLAAVGGIFVVSSMWALGVTGTYLGDYFGILMTSRVTGFPFNVVSNPMYDGSTMLFIAQALYRRSPAGLVLALLVLVVYRRALLFEEPFTAYIYSRKGK